MGPQGRAQTLNKEKILSASLEAVQDLLGRYFGLSLDFKFNTAGGSPHLQGLSSVHVPFSPLVFFKQSVGISSIFMMLAALLALTSSPGLLPRKEFGFHSKAPWFCPVPSLYVSFILC